MNKGTGRVTAISLSVICFILLYSTVTFYVMEEGEKGKRGALQKRFDEVTAVKQDLDSKLKEMDAAAAELKDRLKSQEDTIAAMTKRLDELKGENGKNLSRLQESEGALKGANAALQSERAANAEKLDKLNAECANLKSQLKGLLKDKESADEKVKTEGVSLGTIVMDRKGKN